MTVFDLPIFEILTIAGHIAETLPYIAAGLIVLAVVVKWPRVLWAIMAGV